MNLDRTKKLDNFLSDIEILKKRSELLDKILSYYDDKTMNIVIPEKWKGRVRQDKLPAESPRHLLRHNLLKYLSEEELSMIGIYGLNVY